MVSRIERNIVKEILRECYPRNLHPNENFVMYVVKLLLLNPNWGITENLLTSRSNVQKLVKYIIHQLESKESGRMMTLKMQFYFIWSIDHIEDVLTNNKITLMNRLHPIKEQICMTTEVANDKEMDAYKRLIVVYIVFISGLGNPMKDEIYSEGLAALKSVMTDEELREFCSYPKDEKEEQLVELSKIVCGIRLFNKYCDKGGAGIPDLPDLFKTAVKLVKEEMTTALVKVLKNVTVLTKLYEKYYVLRKNAENYYLECVFPASVDAAYIETCKDQLIHFRQYELFVRKALESLETLMQKVLEIEDEIEALMEHIFRIVGSRLAVPVAIIFPLFNQLSNLWTGLQHQVILLSRYSTIVSNLEDYSKSIYFNQNLFDELMSAESVDSYDQRWVDHTEGLAQSNEQINTVEFDPAENIELQCLQHHTLPSAIYLQRGVVNFGKYPQSRPDDRETVKKACRWMEYLGFCCWKLVETNGALIPGNPDMGVAVYHNKHFAFSSQEAFSCFSKKPEQYVKHVLNLAREKPQLINFLMLQDQLLAVSKVKKLAEDKILAKNTQSTSVQTHDEYVIKPYKDTTVKWNVWDLKRDVVTMCNLTKCKTTSTQTVNTYTTNSVRSQTFLLKEKETQTMIDKYTKVPTPSNFIFGLRGRKDDKQFVLDLTRPVEE